MKTLIQTHGSTFLLVLLTASTVLAQQATAQTVTPAIPTEGAVWPSPRISIVITPSTGQTWYKQTYAADVYNSIQRWTQSIIVFTDQHGYKYLRQLTFDTYTTGINITIPNNPNIQISFVQSFPSTGPQALGVTQSRTTFDNKFDPPVTMRLATFDPNLQRQLSDNDMVNIATHEFGHALGLDHANTLTTDDNFLELMGTEYNLPVGASTNPLEAPSTLDLYALTRIYKWLATSQTLTGPGPAAAIVTLPSTMSYTATYPYPEQIEALKTSLSQANLRITTLLILAIALFAIVITLAALLLRRKQPPPSPVYPVSYHSQPQPTTTLVMSWRFGGGVPAVTHLLF